MLAVLCGDFVGLLAIEVEAYSCPGHRFQVAQRVRMHPQCDTQSLAIDAGQPAQELLVNADGQWQAVTEDRKGLLQLLQELAGVVGRHGACGGCGHE
jgi:hypothetical protein